MVDLGEIARQAGVRPPLPEGDTKKSSSKVSIASGTAIANPPVLHEPSPVVATSPGSVNTEVEAAAEERTAERSASAVDLYERAAREADAASKKGKSSRATSTPPESAVVAAMSAPANAHHHAHATHPPINSPHLHVPHLQAHAHHHHSAPTPMPGQDPAQRDSSNDSSPGTDPSPASQASTNIIPEHYRYPPGAQPYQMHAASPTYGIVQSSPSGHFSTSSSPSYIQHHQQQQQPMYAYHTQLYAPQYSYPPPLDNPASMFPSPGYQNNGQPVPGSPIQQQQQGNTLSSPHHFSPPTFFYTAASPMPQQPPSRAGQGSASQHQQSSSEESSNSDQQPSTDATSFNHQQQFGNHNGGLQHAQQMSMQPTYVQFAPYPQPGMQYVAFSPQPSQHSFASYDMSQHSPNPAMSSVMSGGFAAATSSARTSIDYSAMQQSQYRQIPFAMQGQYASSQPMYGGQHLRYSTAGTDVSSIYPYPLNASIGSATGYQQQQMQNHSAHPLHMSQPAPTELARGHLAQAKLRDAAGAYDPNARLPVSQSERRRRSTGADQRLPRPPAHSPWALWVGNVPSDATHAELWRFFSTRPPPGLPGPDSEEEKDMLAAEAMFPDLPKPDYNGVGIDSIHLISRSNCCFVNMASKRHLDHAILVCNGLSLRPADPRCKNLVCRVRKKDDDTKTGVGAQRGKGMHQAWVAEQERLRNETGSAEDTTLMAAGLPASIGDSPRTEKHAQHQGSASTTHSTSTSSTSSSFFSRHFPKRYFVIKSHTEEDLHLSVERGIWATQSHNEPVLDQAFRTSGSVFLIFGANKSGEFFGYAKMAGPIVKQERRISWMSRKGETEGGESSGSSGQKSSSSGRPAEPSIPEVDESSVQDRPAGTDSLGVPGASASSRPVFSPSASHLVANSPQPMSDNPTPAAEPHSRSADNAKIDYLNVRAHMTDPVSPGPLQSQDVRRGDSMDPRLLSSMQRMDINVISPASASGVADQLAAGSSNTKAVKDDDGVTRKDTALSPEERNARLEVLEKEEEAARNAEGKASSLQDSVEHGVSKPFKVEWVRVQKLPFHRTRHLRNSFNGNREVKISRDGTEIEPNVGASLLELFWKDPNLDLGASTAIRAPQSVTSPTSEVYAF